MGIGHARLNNNLLDPPPLLLSPASSPFSVFTLLHCVSQGLGLATALTATEGGNSNNTEPLHIPGLN